MHLSKKNHWWFSWRKKCHALGSLKGHNSLLYTFQKLGQLALGNQTLNGILEAFGNLIDKKINVNLERHDFFHQYGFQEFDSLEFSLHYQKQNLCHAHLNRAKYVSYPSTAASSLCKICIWKKIQKLKLIMAMMHLTHRLYETKSWRKKIFSYLTWESSRVLSSCKCHTSTPSDALIIQTKYM